MKSLQNNINFYKKNWFWAGLWFAQILFFQLLSNTQAGVAAARILFAKTQFFRTELFAFLPFSIGDIFYTLVVLYLVGLFYFVLKKRYRRAALKQGLILLNLLFCWYQISWGLLYAQPPLLSREDLRKPLKTEVLQDLAETYFQQCVQLRAQIPDKVFHLENLSTLKQEISHQEQRLALKFEKGSHLQLSLKPSLFKDIMSYTGISGYYNPFSSEAQYNPNMPDTYVPFTLAHEAAHQIGFAREGEANYIAYLVGKQSNHLRLKYSTYWNTLKTLLYLLNSRNQDFVNRMIARFPEKIRNDYHAEQKYIESYRGRVSQFFHTSNDLFLKSNKQAGAISYQYFIYLIIKNKKGLHINVETQKHK